MEDTTEEKKEFARLSEMINICEKSPYNLKELQNLVIDWAAERNMLNKEAAKNQYLKISEEYGEAIGATLKISKNGLLPLIDGIGDAMVTITIILEQLGKPQFLELSKADKITRSIHSLHSRFIENYAKHEYVACAEIIQSISYLYNLNPVDCLWYVYQIISKRKGVTINGTFIKEE